MSTIIKSTPVRDTPLKARALSDLYCTIQATFRMKFIAKFLQFQHEALKMEENKHTISIKAVGTR
jgi:hypothetical protein